MLQLTDLIHSVSRIFTPPAPPRTEVRPLLVVPVHEEINSSLKEAEVREVLTVTAAQIAGSGLVWKWIKADGSSYLVSWDKDQKLFLQGTLEDWRMFFSDGWRVRDTKHIEYRGPSLLVTDRLIAAVLAHHETPRADWALQLRMKREGKWNCHHEQTTQIQHLLGGFAAGCSHSQRCYPQ
jgi:hypothetical protein